MKSGVFLAYQNHWGILAKNNTWNQLSDQSKRILGLYGIDESVAVAYSIVLQMLTFTVIGVQGMLVTAYCGFNLSREHQRLSPS